MKLIVGLGNPESKYNWTRHNTGFLALDFYFKLNSLEWNPKPRLGALWGRRDEVIFIKPQDFYNESGLAVRNYLKYYKLSTSDVLVVCDDFNLEFGKVRCRETGSAGGNNGLKSIITELKTEDFARLRVGTGNDELRNRVGDVNFVLSRFTPEEKVKLPGVLKSVADRIDQEVGLA
ncbi:MAG: aminoacyl-tRNA hydrolase [Candidatus Saccharibacteria bacterium]|nr:aminoacyl-tRNA hydrolase [Candidatus Saccharibacteria bacterium]